MAKCSQLKPITMASVRKLKDVGESAGISGAHLSARNSQLLTSTGLSSLDLILGGGLALNTVCMIEEDISNVYAQLVQKLFLAEGVVLEHGVFLGTAEARDSHLRTMLPGLIKHHMRNHISSTPSEKDEMNIAWRYKDSRQARSLADEMVSDHVFSFSAPALNTSEHYGKGLWSAAQCSGCRDHGGHGAGCYTCLVQALKVHLKERKPSSILRVSFMSLGTPLWGQRGKEDLPWFLYQLRSIMRSASCSVAVVTVPVWQFESEYCGKLRRLVDYSIKLDAFQDIPQSESSKVQNAAYQDYQGLVDVARLPRLNSLVKHIPGTGDLAFKMSKGRLSIERLHLPPELGDAPSRDQGRGPCGSSSSKLDF